MENFHPDFLPFPSTSGTIKIPIPARAIGRVYSFPTVLISSKGVRWTSQKKGSEMYPDKHDKSQGYGKCFDEKPYTLCGGGNRQSDKKTLHQDTASKVNTHSK
jgi:hypothetical protein